jgi:hypothetical protein
MLRFKEVKEVKELYTPTDDVEIIRIAESITKDVITFVKLKDNELYQISMTLENGVDIFDTFSSFEQANNVFEQILAIELV